MKLRIQGGFDHLLGVVSTQAKPLVVIDVTICSHENLPGVARKSNPTETLFKQIGV